MGYLLLKISLILLIFVLFRNIGFSMITYINALSSDFLSVSISGMDSSVLVCGRPFGGCSILYRKSLASCIVPLVSCSNRFCAVKFCADVSMLLICVYMPSSSCSSLFNESQYVR